MNRPWRKILVLCALLLSNEVICQDDAAADATSASAIAADPEPYVTDADAVTDAAGSAAAPDATAAPDAGTTAVAAAGEEASATSAAAAGDSPLPFTVVHVDFNADNQDGGATGTTAGPSVQVMGASPAGAPEDSHVSHEVKCVELDEISESNAVKVEVATADCEETKRIILENPEGLCQDTKCDLKIFQSDKTALVASDNAKWSALAEAFQSGLAREKLGVTKIETPPPSPSSSGSSVLAGILVTGLLGALAITVGYFKCQRRSTIKGVRLAEEANPVDPENQGNTLESVAPLNLPPEAQEKPVVNGEPNEAAKTPPPPPPTNGHSTAKTADTEM